MRRGQRFSRLYKYNPNSAEQLAAIETAVQDVSAKLRERAK